MAAKRRLTTADVPQADTLAYVRTIVEAAHRGARTNAALVLATSFSERHVRYRIQAANILRLLDEHLQLTSRGTSLLATERGSEAERSELRSAIQTAPIVRAVAPKLLSGSEVDLRAITKKLMTLTGLSLATADRRAHVLRSWSRQVAPKAEPANADYAASPARASLCLPDQ